MKRKSRMVAAWRYCTRLSLWLDLRCFLLSAELPWIHICITFFGVILFLCVCPWLTSLPHRIFSKNDDTQLFSYLNQSNVKRFGVIHIICFSKMLLKVTCRVCKAGQKFHVVFVLYTLFISYGIMHLHCSGFSLLFQIWVVWM